MQQSCPLRRAAARDNAIPDAATRTDAYGWQTPDATDKLRPERTAPENLATLARPPNRNSGRAGQLLWGVVDMSRSGGDNCVPRNCRLLEFARSPSRLAGAVNRACACAVRRTGGHFSGTCATA